MKALKSIVLLTVLSLILTGPALAQDAVLQAVETVTENITEQAIAPASDAGSAMTEAKKNKENKAVKEVKQKKKAAQKNAAKKKQGGKKNKKAK